MPSENLAPKTVERYREHAAYLSPELLAKPLTEITPLHLNREWTRLLKTGGHTRQDQIAAPAGREDCPQYRRCRFKRIRACDQVGAGYDNPGHQQ